MELWTLRVNVSQPERVIDELQIELASRAMTKSTAIFSPDLVLKEKELTARQQLILWLGTIAANVPMKERRATTFQQFVARSTCHATQPEAWLFRTSNPSAKTTPEHIAALCQEHCDSAVMRGWHGSKEPRILSEIRDFLVDAPAAAIKLRA